ncbi:hypothetical protein FH972_006975 [Carpinus fangiana]|uniref:BHLH domain-containing protein n=1 Tax=Carpinus fangiana TaxID=176857 RepID=A0A5N6QVR4_9ROSI|nr:hypothetical protein FH972_006975 [Carpinus fangiana]
MREREREMDQRKTDNNFATDSAPSTSQPPNRSHGTHPDSRQGVDGEIKDPVAARKVQKADREKLRRDRLNEQFLELGNTLDPDRPKNDKATILADTIQVLKDLTAEVNRLKAECTGLTEESHELMQEKNELREEKSSLKSDIENLNVQYQQRLRVMFPWAAIDPSVVVGPPYSYPVPVSVPAGPIPLHPSLQPFPFFGNQNQGAIANPCSTFIPYPTPPNPPMEQPPAAPYASTSQISSKQDPKRKSSDHQKASNVERCDDSNDVATKLELKMPGSSAQQDLSSVGRKGKQSQRKDRSVTENGSSSRYSSSRGLQDSPSNSVGDMPKSKN